MSHHKQITPMQKVSPEMQKIREQFATLGFKHVGLNRCDTVSSTYNEWRNLHQVTSIRHAVKNDRTELFIKQLETEKNIEKSTFQIGISFNYTSEEQEKVIIVSLTENFFTVKNPKEKILIESIYLEAMDVSSFKIFAKEMLSIMEAETYLVDIKKFLSQCKISSSFKEKDKKLNRMINK